MAGAGDLAAADDTDSIGVLRWAEVNSTAPFWAFMPEAAGHEVELVRIDTTSSDGIVETGDVNVTDGVDAQLAAGDTTCGWEIVGIEPGAATFGPPTTRSSRSMR